MSLVNAIGQHYNVSLILFWLVWEQINNYWPSVQICATHALWLDPWQLSLKYSILAIKLLNNLVAGAWQPICQVQLPGGTGLSPSLMHCHPSVSQAWSMFIDCMSLATSPPNTPPLSYAPEQDDILEAEDTKRLAKWYPVQGKGQYIVSTLPLQSIRFESSKFVSK